MRRTLKLAVTSAVVLIAVILLWLKYDTYLANPWTRDGQVRANIVQVASRVSGPIINLPVRDNQIVKAGDLLFEIDPRTFQAAYDQARASLDKVVDDLVSLDKEIDAASASVDQYASLIKQSESEVESATAMLAEAQKEHDRYYKLVKDGNATQARYDIAYRDLVVAEARADQARSALIQARAALAQSNANLARAIATRGARGDENPQLRAAKAALESARLNLEFTTVRASVNGYVSNLQLRLGSQAVANQPILALIDSGSFWIDAFFRETLVAEIDAGNRVAITLMSYPDVVVPGTVESVGWGISQDDGSTGEDLLTTVSPTFEWIRLAQRIPVRVQIGTLPEGVELRVGTTASVLVMTGTTSVDAGEDLPPPAPSLLQ